MVHDYFRCEKNLQKHDIFCPNMAHRILKLFPKPFIMKVQRLTAEKTDSSSPEVAGGIICFHLQVCCTCENVQMGVFYVSNGSLSEDDR